MNGLMKMVNKRFLEKAQEWRSKEVPESKEAKTSTPNLKQILERDENRRPILNLTPIEKTAVNTPTQEDYWTLMRTYEIGGWKWASGELPTSRMNLWTTRYKQETCMGAGFDLSENRRERFKTDKRNFYLGNDWNIISPQEFYDAQNPKITPEMLDEINAWFEGEN